LKEKWENVFYVYCFKRFSDNSGDEDESKKILSNNSETEDNQCENHTKQTMKRELSEQTISENCQISKKK